MGVGRGEGGRVLQEFGDQMAHVVGGEARDPGVRRQGLDGDPFVPLDLADRGAQYVDEGDRADVSLVVIGPREDQHVLAVAPHDGGHVVQLEEGRETLGVLLALLHALDDAELTLDEAEGAQRQVHEGVVHGVPEPFQLPGEFRHPGLELGPLERECLTVGGRFTVLALHAPEPAGDVVLQSVQLAVQGVDGAYDLGELVVAPGVADRFGGLGLGGDTAGPDPQDRERLGEGAGDRRGDADGDQQAAAEQGEAELQRGDVVVAQCFQPFDLRRAQRGLDPAHAVDTGGQRRLDLLGVGLPVAVRQFGAVGEPGEVLLRPRDLGAGDRGGETVPCGGAGGLVELGEGGEFAHPGLLGRGAQLVAGAVALAVPRVLALHGQTGERVGLLLRLRTGYGERGQQQSPCGGGLFDGGAEGERGAGGVGGARRGLLREFVGEVVQLGDDLGVRLVGLHRGALAGEGGPAEGGDGGEVPAQRRGGGLQDLVHLLVDTGRRTRGAVLAVALLTAARDVGGHLVALVREGVREGDRLLVQLGERHQALGLVEVRGRSQGRRGARRDDGDPYDGNAGDEPAAYPHGPLGGTRCLRRRPGLLARAVLAPRPLLLHRCSQS